VETGEGRKIALFFTGRQHAGENLAQVLKQRVAELPVPIQLADALSRNAPKSVEVLLANCIAHGRRQFVKITPNFPEQYRHVLEALGEVYHHDKMARERGLSRMERLRLHQQHSKPVMDDLHQWLEAQSEGEKSRTELRLREGHGIHVAALASPDLVSARARRSTGQQPG
jgi:hypothetical protein